VRILWAAEGLAVTLVCIRRERFRVHWSAPARDAPLLERALIPDRFCLPLTEQKAQFATSRHASPRGGFAAWETETSRLIDLRLLISYRQNVSASDSVEYVLGNLSPW